MNPAVSFSLVSSACRESSWPNLTLDLGNMCSSDIDIVIRAWKTKAGGQKIGTIITLSQQKVQEMAMETRICDYDYNV